LREYNPTIIPAQPGWEMICAKHDDDDGKVVGLNHFDIISWLICPYDTKEDLGVITHNGISAYVQPVVAGDHGPYKVLKTPYGKFLGNFEYYFKDEEEIIKMYKELNDEKEVMKT
jgi:hypothetical protein